MPKYLVRGESSVSWGIEVEAENEREAKEIARDTWGESADVLDSDTNIFDIEELKE